MKECPFCNIDKEKIENTILEETKHFYIMPSLGSLVDGYILIISKRHINSMASLTKEEHSEYQKIIFKYQKIFKSAYHQYPIVFEHGSINDKSLFKASSVTHAHTHIVNHHFKKEEKILNDLNFKKINNLNDLDIKNDYIFYLSFNNKMYLTNEFKPISQIMRLKIANDLDLLDKYDWQTNKFEENIKLTIEKIKKIIK